MTISDAIYFAVPDPSDPSRMTYWRRSARGRLVPWPTKAQYGPVLLRADVPADLDRGQRDAWVRQWHEENSWPWRRTINQAITDDADLCQARFAAFNTRCCVCGRLLTDEASKTYGIGPDCRGGMPAEQLAQLTEVVGRAHSEHLAASAP